MKKLLYLSISCALIAFLSACTASNTEKGGINDSDSIEQVVIPDTAIYGIIDESTTVLYYGKGAKELIREAFPDEKDEVLRGVI